MMKLRTITLVFVLQGVLFAPAFAVTNLQFAGGCPSGEDDPLCFNSGNASTANVALLLGVDQSLVTQIGGTLTVDGSNGDFAATGIGTRSGTWSVMNTDITHLAFKGGGYYILGKVNGMSGDWSMNIEDWLAEAELTVLTCPQGICNPVARNYQLADFRNNGGNVADLGNMRAFNVVPVPAAVWLLGSALAALSIYGRRSAIATTGGRPAP